MKEHLQEHFEIQQSQAEANIETKKWHKRLLDSKVARQEAEKRRQDELSGAAASNPHSSTSSGVNLGRD